MTHHLQKQIALKMSQVLMCPPQSIYLHLRPTMSVIQIIPKQLYNKMPKKSKHTKKRILDTDIYYEESQAHSYQKEHVQRSYELRKTQALDMLNGTHVPSKFKFRQREIQKIEAFLKVCLKKQKKGYKFLMITGSPGAGKSLCANFIFSKLDCQVIKLNANMVKTISEVQQLINQKLLDNPINQTALQMIRDLQDNQYKKTCIVYIQQIQVLFKSAPTVISEDFFLLFNSKKINLILIGISNTIDALQKYSHRFSFKISQIENVVFAPYQVEHIMEILKGKIDEIKNKTEIEIRYPEKLLKFSAQRLQTLKKGDFRICLQFLKELARLSMKQTEKEQEEIVISINQINSILNKMNISKDQVIQSLPYQKQIVLLALYTLLKKTDALMLQVKELQPQLKWICNSLQINYSKQFIDDGLSELQQMGLVQIKKKLHDRKIILKLDIKEIQTALCEHFVFKKFFTN